MRFGLPEIRTSTCNRVRTSPVSHQREVKAPMNDGTHRELMRTPVNSRTQPRSGHLSPYDFSDSEGPRFNTRRSASPLGSQEENANNRMDWQKKNRDNEDETSYRRSEKIVKSLNKMRLDSPDSSSSESSDEGQASDRRKQPYRKRQITSKFNIDSERE